MGDIWISVTNVVTIFFCYVIVVSYLNLAIKIRFCSFFVFQTLK